MTHPGLRPPPVPMPKTAWTTEDLKAWRMAVRSQEGPMVVTRSQPKAVFFLGMGMEGRCSKYKMLLISVLIVHISMASPPKRFKKK